MKKRILAMLLVLCMVMSVMPMTVLAAEADCPGKNKDHTLENCDATLVLSVPAETCRQQSYDLYTCDKCGAMFADNFGDYGPHNYEWPAWIPEEERPSCGAGMYCVNENIYAENFMDRYCDATLDHVFGCDGKCSCGLEGEPGHTWDPELIEITKEPVGCSVPGEATYHCAKCDATKIAPVYGKHIDLKAVEAVEPDCNNSGLIAHDYCAGCDSYWVDGVEVEKEDVTLAPKHTHLAGEYETLKAEPATNYNYSGVAGDVLKVIITIPANSNVRIAHRDENGDDIYVANILTEDEPVVKILTVNPTDTYIIRNRATSGEAIDIEIVVLSTENDIELWVEPSCGGKGIYQIYCGEWDGNGALVAGCGALVTVETITVAHEWILDELKSQPATCYQYGYEIWFCDVCGELKPVKTVPKTNCIDTWAEVLAANKKAAGTVNVIADDAPTCTQKGYYQWECPYCDTEFTWQPKATGCKLQTGTYPATKCTVGYTYRYCANPNCDNDAVHTPENMAVATIVGKDCVHSYSTIKVNPAADHAWYLDSTSATCTEAGYELYLCVCGDYKLVQVKAYGHSGYTTQKNKVNTLVVEEATCTEKGCSYYTCKDCGQVVYVTENIPFVHKPLMSIDEVLKYHGADEGVVAFVDIDGDGIADEVPFEEVIDPKTMYDPELSLWTVVPSCEKVGYINVECKDCLLNERKHSITVYAGGSHDFGDVSGLDCLDDPVRCQNGCGAVYKVDHKWSIPAVEATCQNEGHSGYGVCSICGETKNAPDEIYPSLHDFVDDDPIIADCDSWGGQPATCPVCDASKITDYVPNLHYVNPALSQEGPDNGGTVKRTQSGALCQSDVKVTEKCTVCSYKNEYKIAAIGHHVNVHGYEIFPDMCLDCMLEKHDVVEPGAMWHSWYLCQYCGEHVWENLGKDPTCTEDGYGVFAFTCGHSGYSSYLAPLNHEYWPGNSAWVDNVNYGIYTCSECDLCHAQKNLKSTGDIMIGISDDTDKGDYYWVTDGSTIALTIDLSGYKTDLFGYCLRLGYNADLFQYVGFDALSENLKYNSMVTNKIYTEEYGYEVLASSPLIDLSAYNESYSWNTGVVTMVGQAAPDSKNFTLTGEEGLVTLYFKVIGAKDYCDPDQNHDYHIWNFTLISAEIYANNAKKTDLVYVDAIVYDGDYEFVDYWFDDDVSYEYYYDDGPMGLPYKEYFYGIEFSWVYDHDVDVYMLMDADRDDEVTYKDAAYVWQMASGAFEYSYDPCIDINRNGEIDHVDAKLIYQYVVGLVTYEEVMNYGA